jgi:lipopolysaccharide export system permease protein
MKSFTRRSLLNERYILRAHVGPFFFSLVTLMFVFLLQFIMKFIDQLVGKGLTAWVIIELIALSLSWMLVLAVPMSVLVATLMAFGDLSSRNEITAMKASGISTYRMMLPVAVAAAVVAYLLVLFNNDVLPETNHRLRALTVDIRRKKPTINLRNGVFSQDIPGYSILVRRTSENTNDLEGVTLFDYTNPGMNVVITAESGTISFSQDFRTLIMDLHRGEIHELDLRHMSAYRRIRFENHRIAMNVEGFDFTRTSESAFQRGDRELSAQAMLSIVDSLSHVRDSIRASLQARMQRETESRLTRPADTSSSLSMPNRAPVQPPASARVLNAAAMTENYRIEALDRQIDQFMVEVHKKFAIPAACLVFVLIGVPLGIMARRGGFGMAATLSLGFFILYYACLIGGEKLADRDIVSPFIGMWLANILVGLMGVYLTIRVARETVVINWTAGLRFLPRRWRQMFRFEHDEETLSP